MVPPTEQSHYFDTEPKKGSNPSNVRLDLPDVSFVLATDSGVFAKSGVDVGTKLLLLTPSPSGTSGARDKETNRPKLLADVGCGYGPIALTIASRNPQAHVWAIDVNQRARELCQTNAETAGLSNITVAAPDEVPAEVTFDQIWSNPPIRIGKTELHKLLKRWLGRLRPDGCSFLVVQKHLGADSLQKWLETQDFVAQRYRSQKGYRLLSVEPRPGTEPATS